MTSFHRPLYRPEPMLPVTAMQTHQALAPLETHWRKATCEEVDCLAWREGYGIPLKSLDDEDLGLIRQFVQTYKLECVKIEIADGEFHLWFEAGQRCLRADTHRLRNDDPYIFLTRDGDHRGNPSGRDPVIFSGADAFADHLHTALEQIGE